MLPASTAPESRFVEDVKISPRPTDVEQGSDGLPSYPLNEPEELIVGGRGARCHRWRAWLRRRRCGNFSNENRKKPRSKVLRALKFLFAGWLLLSVAHFVVTGFKFHKAYRSLECMAIAPSNHTDGLDVTIPLGPSGRIFVHDSLSGGDSHILHDSNVANGTVQFAVKFADASKQDKVYDGCVVQFKRGTAVGLIPRETNGDRAKIAGFAIRVPAALTHPSVRFVGEGDKHISDRKLQKILRWWRKHHQKKDTGYIESDD